MKHGIYYAFWEQEWTGDYIRYIKKVSALGFDILEIAAHQILGYTDARLAEIRACSKDNGIVLTAGIGPPKDKNLSSADESIRTAGRKFFQDTLKQIAKLDVHTIGGALYSYWPIDYTKPVDKTGDRKRAITEIRAMADFAADLGITLCMEVLNRFENHILNTAAEGTAFVKEVNKENVKVMLDTFHLNIEEESIAGAIRTAGAHLGHFHTGECNRMPPGKGRMPWREIGEALRDIHYSGAVVMEPFIKMGGTVGSDIKVWRDLSGGADEEAMDKLARDALIFSRYMLG
ncbi:MAG: dolichol monophosphate mannose synthase [Spirochaeta sp. LUC14_002_19_P3]|nr:MAG: dolichol monophosphate mannose synthase [Spirochaeta sp. LUC14_002_19_P3]